MASSFPSGLDSFTTKVDGSDTIQAAHVNDLQNAIVAVETALGIAMTVASFTPTISGVVIGNGSVAGSVIKIGKLVFVRMQLTFGTTTAVGALNLFGNLPYSAASNVILSGYGLRQGVGYYPLFAPLVTASPTATQGLITGSGAVVNSTTPATWANADVWVINGCYITP